MRRKTGQTAERRGLGALFLGGQYCRHSTILMTKALIQPGLTFADPRALPPMWGGSVAAGSVVRASTLSGLLQAHGPLVGCDAAASLLGFNSRGSFLRAVKQGRVHLPLVRPPGRRKAFVSAQDLAEYLTQLAEARM